MKRTTATPGLFGPPGGAAPIGRLRLGRGFGRGRGLWLVVLAWLAVCGAAPATRAQVQVLDDEVEVEVEGEVDVQDPAMQQRLRLQALQQQRFMVADSNFDMRVFGTMRNAPTARTRLEALAKLKVDEADRIVRLSEAQKQKLELALRGDIKRFFDKVDEKRKAFQLVRNDQQKFAAFYQELQPLRLALTRGLFGDDSLFAKTLKKTLDEHQTAVVNDLNRQRNLLRQQARIGQVLATLDNSVGLEARQRKQLLKLIVEETHPPKASGPYDVYAVLYQIAQLPRDRLRPIFHESQWRLMSQRLDMMQRYEAMLVNQGVLPLGPEPERWLVPIESEEPAGTPKQEKRD